MDLEDLLLLAVVGYVALVVIPNVKDCVGAKTYDAATGTYVPMPVNILCFLLPHAIAL